MAVYIYPPIPLHQVLSERLWTTTRTTPLTLPSTFRTRLFRTSRDSVVPSGSIVHVSVVTPFVFRCSHPSSRSHLVSGQRHPSSNPNWTSLLSNLWQIWGGFIRRVWRYTLCLRLFGFFIGPSGQSTDTVSTLYHRTWYSHSVLYLCSPF